MSIREDGLHFVRMDSKLQMDIMFNMKTLLNLVLNIFRLRYVIDGSETYCTHSFYFT
ncbi:hypothetical protein HanXRQr2_Chr07g0292111 [Helianthus annuus]|uniref:Uncharacterized protein n=1 Tax=Helianthus annuus TaxID=4232 RepID=A0A9K3NG57_HELAN|nr:hypothetical protein HanXRQr2_Chr07g0292111 [Helianthus annuus]KAJ0549978.1 hypothetical protein HanHA300_Chr07g0240231 [Helianthus annuus]KAJ0556556.1 hypothetical protein HanIR_Chr07g0315221 [Helianthus annuus]KAJ0562939.1 hypothetical protein HanHA89_Chr07g0257471 [Helianthus annuus]KAJ0728305.1 hypothetical protein HanLR1_Chr07g0240121 [Helianthus annuus]